MRKIIATLVVLAACPGDPVADVQVVEFVDEGRLCFQNGDLIVDFQTCLSSSCDTLTDASCDLSLVGDVLTVESYGRIESSGTVCTDDCGFAVASCDLPLIEFPNLITVEFGGQSVLLSDVPDCLQ